MKNSMYIKSKASPSAKGIQNKRQSKQNLQAKTPHMQNHHSRRLEEEGEDTSATKDPRARLEPRSRNSISHLSAASRQTEAENNKSMHNGKELVAGQQQTPGSKMPGSLWKTIKTSCEKDKETNESLSSTAPDTKAEWKMPLEKKNSLTCDNSKNKFACADELNSNEEVLRKDVLHLLYGILKDVLWYSMKY